MKATVAVVIPTFNVEKIIEPTLESVKWCDEIIIVDMFSQDKTKEICLRYPNCRFFEAKNYIYANVNYGIDQAKSDWIIRLDSDEVISEELRRSIESVLSNPNPEFDGYDAISHLYFLGYRLRYGFGYNNWRSTLFKKGFARYPTRSEHEDFERKGRWGKITGHYDHFTNPTISAWVQKINYYTDKDMERVQDPVVPSVARIIYRPLRWFQRYYFYPGRAFKDGMPGFVVACIAACGMLIQELKLWEKAKRASRPSNYVPPHPNA